MNEFEFKTRSFYELKSSLLNKTFLQDLTAGSDVSFDTEGWGDLKIFCCESEISGLSNTKISKNNNIYHVNFDYANIVIW